MKKIFQFLIVILSILSIHSCKDQVVKTKPDSQGALYEMFVVCSQPKWESGLGDTLKLILGAPIAMLNQTEPHFDLLRINPVAYTNLVPRHRNQLIVNTGDKYTKPSMSVQYNVYAEPQIIVSVSAANESSLASYLWKNRKQLLHVFMMAERDRAIETNERHYVSQLHKEIQAKFDFSMKIPQGFDIRKEADGFMWITNEYPLSSLGIIIYEYPYTGIDVFKLNNIVDKRNKFTTLIPGQNDGTHMTTADIEPDIKYQKINNRAWAEVRGFWEVTKDFMGGPFVSYSTIDKQNQRVICIDCYVYSPDKGKRNFMRQLENLIYTVKFPDTTKKQATSADSTKAE